MGEKKGGGVICGRLAASVRRYEGLRFASPTTVYESFTRAATRQLGSRRPWPSPRLFAAPLGRG